MLLPTVGYSDRKADVSAGINQSLMDQSLNQQNRQFKDMMNANEGINRSYLGKVSMQWARWVTS